MGGGYLWCPPIDDVVGFLVPWCLAPFIVGDGDICDELVEMDLGELVYISVCFSPFANEFGKMVPWGVWENILRWNLRWWMRTA